MCTRFGYMVVRGEGNIWEYVIGGQRNGLWGWKVDRAGSGSCPLAEHSECHEVLQGNCLFGLNNPAGCLKTVFFTAELSRPRLCFWISWLSFVTSDVRMNIGSNVKLGAVCSMSVVHSTTVELSTPMNCLQTGTRFWSLPNMKRGVFFYLFNDSCHTSSCKMAVKTKRFVFVVGSAVW